MTTPSLPSQDHRLLLAGLLSHWQEAADASARLINHSENHTFLIEGPAGRFTLRLHRPGYQSRPSIESELNWLDALRRDTALPVAEPVRGRDGALLQDANGQLAVLFCFVDGREPQIGEPLEKLFETLGGFAAHLHRHVEHWAPPSGFTRQVWNAAQILDSDGLWGNWRIAPGVDTAMRPLLDRADTRLRQVLAEYGTSPNRFGLIHADMRLGNLLVHGEQVTLIDFDDSGFCWFAYDFAAAISFHETHADIPALKSAWLAGYQRIRPLQPADIAIIDAMILLRRFALLAWIGSHNETGLAQQHMPGFAEGTAQLARAFLA